MTMTSFGIPVLGIALFSCSDSVSDNGKTTVIKGQKEQVYITLQAENSPLKTVELTKEDLPQVVTEELNDADQTIAVGNVLRAPCLEEWSRGDTLNQSIQKGDCTKSIDWLKSVDTQLKVKKSVQDVLFTMVAPGPFLPSIDSTQISVVVEEKHLKSELLKNRVQFFIDKSLNVTFYVEIDTEIHEMSPECFQSGQELTAKVEGEGCIRHTSAEVKDTLQRVIEAQQKPVWLIQGYRLSGFQSNDQLSRVLQLP